eukprot:3297042-Prymnesium_polylepis.1
MRTPDVSTTLTLGRDARKPPRPTPPHSPRRRDAAISNIARSRFGYATHDRMRVCHAWQQALRAQRSAQMRTSDVSTTLTLGRDTRSHSPTARAGGTQQSPKSLDGRIAQMRTSDVSTTLTLGRDMQ